MRLPSSIRLGGFLLAVAGLGVTACAPTAPPVSAPPPMVRDGSGTQPNASNQDAPAARSQVPDVLVGTWDGGSKATDAKITFSADGNVRLDYNNGRTIHATVVVLGATMTLHYPDNSQQTIGSWSIDRIDGGYGYEFLNLSLDGYSYVRQTSGG